MHSNRCFGRTWDALRDSRRFEAATDGPVTRQSASSIEGHSFKYASIRRPNIFERLNHLGSDAIGVVRLSRGGYASYGRVGRPNRVRESLRSFIPTADVRKDVFQTSDHRVRRTRFVFAAHTRCCLPRCI